MRGVENMVGTVKECLNAKEIVKNFNIGGGFFHSTGLYKDVNEINNNYFGITMTTNKPDTFGISMVTIGFFTVKNLGEKPTYWTYDTCLSNANLENFVQNFLDNLSNKVEERIEEEKKELDILNKCIKYIWR